VSLTLITPPAAEPVALVDAKSHLRVDTTDEDTLITALITAAREWAEEIQARAYITQTWELVLDEFPESDEIRLPRPPLLSVVSVKYKDESGSETTWDASNYIVDTDREPGRLVLAANKSWPLVTLYPAAGIRVRFTAGFGTTADDIPERIKAAIKLLLGHLYEHREAVSETRLNEIPLGAKRLLQLDKMVRI